MTSKTTIITDAFDEGMIFSSAYGERTDSEIWEFYRHCYLNFIKHPPSAPKIPKKLHQIWLGSELPSIYKPLIKQLKALHPDWEYRLWTEDDVHLMKFPNKSLFLESQNYGQKSDILRYEILHRYGGIYLDLDFVAIKPMDNLLKFDFFGSMAYDSSPNLINAAIGSKANSSLTKRLVSFDRFNSSSEAMAIMESTGPYHFTRSIHQAMIEDSGGVVLPCSYFYPYPNFPKDRTLGENYKNYISEKTTCCHLWHCSWLKAPKNKSSYFRKFLEKARDGMRLFR